MRTPHCAARLADAVRRAQRAETGAGARIGIPIAQPMHIERFHAPELLMRVREREPPSEAVAAGGVTSFATYSGSSSA
jgi:hypothetical protein